MVFGDKYSSPCDLGRIGTLCPHGRLIHHDRRVQGLDLAAVGFPT